MVVNTVLMTLSAVEQYLGAYYGIVGGFAPLGGKGDLAFGSTFASLWVRHKM